MLFTPNLPGLQYPVDAQCPIDCKDGDDDSFDWLLNQ